ncbi:MAG: spore germination protein [Ruthenibacterium sp.]
MPLQEKLTDSKKLLQDYFGDTVDFYTKDIKLCGISCCICIFEGLSSLEKLWIMMLDGLSKETAPPADADGLFQYLMNDTAIPLETQSVNSVESVCTRLTSGAGVVLIDGSARAVAIATQSLQFRSVQEAGSEGNLRGSKEGFTEPLRVNISLVRRLIRTGDLRVEMRRIGEKTQTEMAVLYSASLVPKKILAELYARLEKARLPFVFDTGYLAAFLREGSFGAFQAVGYTERPDTAAAKICEGKIVILVNGSPFAMIVPHFFSENFQSMDDYTEKAYFASFVRLLKYTAFFIAVMLPGVFVAIVNFTPELLPQQLLYRIAAAEQATPLPLFLEALFVNFLLELVREAGLRMPKPIGQSVSLVAALIVGDAAISAGLVGTPTVIVIALTAICGYVVPSLYEPVTGLRVAFILAGGILGPLGIVVLAFWMLLNACSMQVMGLPYTEPFAPASSAALRDGLIRAGWKRLMHSHYSVWKHTKGERANESEKP